MSKDDDKNEVAAAKLMVRVATETFFGVTAAAFCGCQIRKVWFPLMPAWHIPTCPLNSTP